MVRSSARKVLRIIKLEDVSMFKLCVDGLLENLEVYPQVCYLNLLLSYRIIGCFLGVLIGVFSWKISYSCICFSIELQSILFLRWSTVGQFISDCFVLH